MKFFVIVKTLDKKQWSGFLTYLKLYYRPEGTVCKVANWFDSKSIWKTSQDPDFTSEELSYKLPFKMKPQTISNTISILGKVAEEYLGWMVWRDSGNLKTSCQLQGLAEKSLSDQYLQTQKEVLKESDDKVVSIWDEHYRMQAYFNDYYFGISSAEDNYFEVFSKLLNSYVKSAATIAQLLMVEIKNREKLLSESWTDQLQYFNFMYQPDTNLKSIADQLIRMNFHEEEAAYLTLTKLLESDQAEKLSHLIKYSIVSYSVNYLTRIIREGELHRGPELLDFYENSLEKGIFTINDKMPLQKFINVINIATKLGGHERSRKIIDKWAHKVDEHNIKSIAKYGHATIDFKLEKYESVVQTLSQIKSSNFIHRLRSRWLLLIAQYEINNDQVEVMKVQLDNFRRFIKSNESRISTTTFIGMKTSIRILNLLLKRKSKRQIEEFYSSSKYVFEQTWILEKIKNPA